MKGAVLTQISAWWFKRLENVVPHHMISADADAIIDEVPDLKNHRADIVGRAMLCKRTTVFPIECVIRGYISGSAWKEYAASGTLAGEKLPDGLTESAKLEPEIFSPATKAETGHDENITVSRVREIVGEEVAHKLEQMARTVYTLGEKIAREHGIIIADTKFEFGRDKDDRIILIDEVMTPDSSGRNRASTSSRCATISTPSARPAAGTAMRRRQSCREAWWRRPASGTWKRIGASREASCGFEASGGAPATLDTKSRKQPHAK
jgi:phosphoribosylaminoimidazole-succinocarboxamide synthase